MQPTFLKVKVAVAEHGPSPDHRYSFVNVAGAARLAAGRAADSPDGSVGHNGDDDLTGFAPDEVDMVDPMADAEAEGGEGP